MVKFGHDYKSISYVINESAIAPHPHGKTVLTMAQPNSLI